MKKLLPLALLGLLLTGCAQDQYDAAHEAAAVSKSSEQNLGFGFRSGMSRQEAEHHKAELEASGKLVFATSLEQIKLDDLRLGYLNNQLVEVIAHVDSDSKYDFDQLQEALAARYKSQRHPHDRIGHDAVSWFNGPIEIETYYHDVLGGYVSYQDLRQEDAYIMAQAQATIQEMKEDSTRTAEVNKQL